MFVYLFDVIFLWKGVRDTFMKGDFVRFGIEYYGIRFVAVTSCTSCFLEISFGRVRQIEVDYDTYIGFVDPHAKSIGGNHYTAFSCLPAMLTYILGGIIQTGMVEVGGNLFIN